MFDEAATVANDARFGWRVGTARTAVTVQHGYYGTPPILMIPIASEAPLFGHTESIEDAIRYLLVLSQAGMPLAVRFLGHE